MKKKMRAVNAHSIFMASYVYRRFLFMGNYNSAYLMNTLSYEYLMNDR